MLLARFCGRRQVMWLECKVTVDHCESGVAYRRVFFSLFLLNSMVLADDAQLVYGKWGNERQCTRALIIPGGTVYAAPFEIDRDWLRHGQLWCRLRWVSSSRSSTGVFAVALALCGEDEVRDYKITIELRDDELSLQWNEQITNRFLKRCL